MSTVGKEDIKTLCIVYKHPRVLLGYKKRGFGASTWSGFEGKTEENDSIENFAKRWLKKESGLTVVEMKEVGILSFEFKNDGKKSITHVFKVSDFFGEEKESDEMAPKWFFIDEVPFKNMRLDSVYWMPLFFAGRNFEGKFIFEDDNTLLDKSVNIV